VIASCWLFGYTYVSNLRDIGDRVLADADPGTRRDTQRPQLIFSRGAAAIPDRTAGEAQSSRCAYTLAASAVLLTRKPPIRRPVRSSILMYDVNVDTANGPPARLGPARCVHRGSVSSVRSALIAQPGAAQDESCSA